MPRKVNRAGLQTGASPIRDIRVRSSLPPLSLPATLWPPREAAACVQALSLSFPSPALPMLLIAALFQH